MLRLSQETAEATAEATARAGEAAAATRAPSHVLTAARAAARGVHNASPGGQRLAEVDLANTGHFREDAGALKAALQRLGVENPDLLQRAADLDRASEQLIIEAAGRSHQPAAGYQPEQPEAEP
ncbi:MAG TPA: hypothetical protein VFQ68_26145 [Streptosporangiaceae bacterium]|nr:hypothetical protein [Streptosporangiaceae bacterium]